MRVHEPNRWRFQPNALCRQHPIFHAGDLVRDLHGHTALVPPADHAGDEGKHTTENPTQMTVFVYASTFTRVSAGEASEARRFWVSETSLKNGFYFSYLTLRLTTSFVKTLECCKRLLLKLVFPENKFSFTDLKIIK